MVTQENPKTFQIYTASAGSGKTFRLTLEYLKLALSSPEDNFRKILAITFTVKATNEMKARIIEACKAFAEKDNTPLTGRNKALFDTLLQEVPWTEREITTKSATLYKKILHNYSDFNISTIDSFSQRLIRSFAYELKLPIQFEVMVDHAPIIDHLLAKAFAAIGQDKEFTSLMLSFFENKLREDDSIYIEADIEKAINILFEDESEQPIAELSSIENEELKKIGERLNAKFFATKKKIEAICREASVAIAKEGLAFSDFNGGSSRGVANIFYKILEDPKTTISDTFKNLVTGVKGSWFTQASKRSHPALEERLAALGRELIIAQNEYKLYLLLRKNYPQIALLAKLSNLYKDYKKEEEVLPISEFNTTINREVRDQPAPFLYEKIGDYFEHLLLDEFQDTSVIQWHNLVPMVTEILSKEHQPKSLVVGDSKQAIYRFRGGETKQLTALPKLLGMENEPVLAEQSLVLERFFDPQYLAHNFRSREEVINFNNQLYAFIANHPELTAFDTIYNSYFQKFPAFGKKGGYVTINVIEKEEDEDAKEFKARRLEKLVAQIRDAHQRGFPYEKLSVLCRKNKELREVAEILQQVNISFVSKESLALNQEKYITVFPALVQWFSTPDNQVLQSQIANTFKEVGIIEIDKHELNREIGHRKMKTVEAFSTFIQELNPHLNLAALNYTELFGLFEIYCSWLPQNIQQSAFISFFRDELWALIQKEGNNIEAFLDWWIEKQNKLYVKSSDQSMGVNLLTIHKSKGLEFEVVFMPFADWKTSNSLQQEYRWLLANALDEKISHAYLPMQKDLESTIFADAYLAYQEDNLLDQLNLLYVATTRAVSELHILTEKTKTIDSNKKAKPLNTASNMGLLWANFLDEDDQDFFDFGQPVSYQKPEEEEQAGETLHLGQQQKEFGEATVAVRNRASVIWSDDIRGKIDFGEVVHQLLAQITTTNQIDEVVMQAVADGLLNMNQIDEVKPLLEKVVNHADLADFFTTTYEVLAEQPIVTPTGQEYIPDRIAKLNENQVKILDFKTGQEKNSHKAQVNSYADLLSQMGFEVLSKQLVYLDENEVRVALVENTNRGNNGNQQYSLFD